MQDNCQNLETNFNKLLKLKEALKEELKTGKENKNLHKAVEIKEEIEELIKEFYQNPIEYIENNIFNQETEVGKQFYDRFKELAEEAKKDDIVKTIKNNSNIENELIQIKEKPIFLLNKSEDVQKIIDLIGNNQEIQDIVERSSLHKSDKSKLNNILLSSFLNKFIKNKQKLLKLKSLNFPASFFDNFDDNFLPFVNLKKEIIIDQIEGYKVGASMSGTINSDNIEGSDVGASMSGTINSDNIEGNFVGYSMSGTINSDNIKGDEVGRSMSGTINSDNIKGNFLGVSMSGTINSDNIEGNYVGEYMSGTILFNNHHQGKFSLNLDPGASIYNYNKKEKQYYITYEKNKKETIDNREDYQKATQTKEEIREEQNIPELIGLRKDPKTKEANPEGLWIINKIEQLNKQIELFEKGIIVLRQVPKSPIPLIKEMTGGVLIIEDQNFQDYDSLIKNKSGGVVNFRKEGGDLEVVG